MTWMDNNGELRPQSWEEYCELAKQLPAWAAPAQNYQPVRPSRARDRERLPRMRTRLFRADPHCFWCGCLVRLNVPHGTPDLATVDHLYSRFHPARKENHKRQDRVLHVLACFACNHERGLCEQHQKPFIPKLPERLEHARLADATLARHPLNQQGTAPLTGTMRVICTLEEAVKFTRENPSR